MPPHHRAAWIIAAASLGGLLLLQAMRGAAPRDTLAPAAAPPACPAVEERLDRYEFDEQPPLERPDCPRESSVVARTS